MVAPPVPPPVAPVSRSAPTARPGPLVAATVAVLVAATFIPLGYVAWSAVSIGWTRAYELIVRPRVGELLFNTVALVVVTVPLCVVLGVGVAWLVERTDLPGRAFWRPLFVAPLAVPAFVNSYAWVGVIPSLLVVPLAAATAFLPITVGGAGAREAVYVTMCARQFGMSCDNVV